MAKRPSKRKQITMVVTVSVPKRMTAAMARQEIRTRINDLCGHYDHLGYDQLATEDVRAVKVCPEPKGFTGAELASVADRINRAKNPKPRDGVFYGEQGHVEQE